MGFETTVTMTCEHCGKTEVGKTRAELLAKHDRSKNGGWGWKIERLTLFPTVTFCSVECEDRWLKSK